MTEFEANKLVLMISYNFGTFMPADIQGAALKKSLWMDELRKHDFHRAEKAVKEIIQRSPYPPTIYDFKTALGVGGELTRDDIQARLPGPTFDTEEGMKALYTANEDHVNEVMQKLMRDLG